MTSFRRFRGLHARRRQLLPLAKAVVVLALITATLPLLGYRRTLGLLQRCRRPKHPGGADDSDVADAVSAVDRAARLLGGRITCLPRACALLLLLNQRGHQARISFGARWVDGNLEAHAWVEVAGIPVGNRTPVASDFMPLLEKWQTTELPAPSVQLESSPAPDTNARQTGARAPGAGGMERKISAQTIGNTPRSEG